jgi:hypothetical protein
LRLRTAEKCEAFRAFALNQGAQSLAKQGSYFGNACQSLGFGEQVIIECDCGRGPHALLLLAETLINGIGIDYALADNRRLPAVIADWDPAQQLADALAGHAACRLKTKHSNTDPSARLRDSPITGA